jgi:hypothetical protein
MIKMINEMYGIITDRLTVAQVESKRLAEAMDELAKYQKQTTELIQQLITIAEQITKGKE